MKIRNSLTRFPIAIALMALAVTTLWQIRRAHAQRGNKVTLSRTADGPDTDTFTPRDHVIYCIVEVPNSDPKATYKFVWGHYDPAASTPKNSSR